MTPAVPPAHVFFTYRNCKIIFVIYCRVIIIFINYWTIQFVGYYFNLARNLIKWSIQCVYGHTFLVIMYYPTYRVHIQIYNEALVLSTYTTKNPLLRQYSTCIIFKYDKSTFVNLNNATSISYFCIALRKFLWHTYIYLSNIIVLIYCSSFAQSKFTFTKVHRRKFMSPTIN